MSLLMATMSGDLTEYLRDYPYKASTCAGASRVIGRLQMSVASTQADDESQEVFGDDRPPLPPKVGRHCAAEH